MLEGKPVAELPWEEVATDGLIKALSTLKLEREYPTRHEIQRLLDAQEYDEIEWDEKSDD